MFLAKKVTSEEVNDDPDESVNSNGSDPEISQKDTQTVAEEKPPTLSGQDFKQTMLEQDQNQEKRRRRKKQNEANEQEAANLVGSALVHSSSPEAEIHKSKFQAHSKNHSFTRRGVNSNVYDRCCRCG